MRQLPGLHPSSPRDSSASDCSLETSKPSRLTRITQKTKAKTKKLLDLDGRGEKYGKGGDRNDDAVGRIDSDPAFNPSKLTRKRRTSGGDRADKTIDAVKSVAGTIVRPKGAIKEKATKTTAGRLSKVEHPYLSLKADLDYLRAHDVLRQAESSAASSTSEVDKAVAQEHRDKIEKLESHRESMRVAWTTSRHIHRVRVVPKRHLRFPERSSFKEFDESGAFVRYKWERWLGHMLVYYTQDFCVQYIDDFEQLPFDLNVLRYHVERLVISSAPWQAWMMHVRRVYLWEDPVKTGKWFALYLVLWYTQHVMGFLYFYVLYTVLRNRFFPSSVKALQESMERALDRNMTAYHFGELIDKHGREDWLGPLLDEMGPCLQLQLGDVANLLEVLTNFYAWKSPKKTAASLFFIFSCLAVSLFADMKFCMKIFWFIAGGSFFLCWPIASIYPKYRYLVSPIKWALWDIPTDAEWSFQYLRRNAQISREKMIEEKVQEKVERETVDPGRRDYIGVLDTPKIIMNNSSGDLENGNIDVDVVSESEDSEDWQSVISSHSILEERDVMSFRGEWNRLPGRLIIYSDGIRFVRSFPTKHEFWRRSFLELAEMRKRSGSSLSKALSLDQHLEIDFTDGVTARIGAMRDRDEAFNTIIGFSGLQWQNLQAGPNSDK